MELKPMPHTFVIFGASGDLTSRKLIPALYQLARKNRLPKETRIVGFSRIAQILKPEELPVRPNRKLRVVY